MTPPQATGALDRPDDLGRPVATAEGALGAARPRGWAIALERRIVALFVVLSVVFGGTILWLNPPLRGPDEPAHFLRIYGLAGGEILPNTRIDGRLGLYLPATMHDDFSLFEDKRSTRWQKGFTYRGFDETYAEHKAAQAEAGERDAVFVPYQGSEGYAPVAYLGYLPVAIVGRALGLDFLTLTTALRIAGLLFATAVMAFAIWLAPRLKWAFFAVGLWPAALYGRTVISADGLSIGFVMVSTALALRVALGGGRERVTSRAVWMALSVLAKPPQIAFAAMELITLRAGPFWPRLRSALLVAVPAILLGPAWVVLVGGEMAAWRVTGPGGIPAHEVDPLWKLGFMLENPGHFPRVMWETISQEYFGLWRQLVGMHGWLDTRMLVWTYWALSGLLLVTAIERLGVGRRDRALIAAGSLLTVVAYVTAVFMVLFITWTPVSDGQVWGVQGRYFVPALPLFLIALAAVVNRGLPRGTTALAALALALLSGAATVESIHRVNWS